MCADIKVPQVSSAAPLFFLNGPSVLSLSVDKIEPSMEGYYLKVETLNGMCTTYECIFKCAFIIEHCILILTVTCFIRR